MISGHPGFPRLTVERFLNRDAATPTYKQASGPLIQQDDAREDVFGPEARPSAYGDRVPAEVVEMPTCTERGVLLHKVLAGGLHARCDHLYGKALTETRSLQ